MKRCSFVGHCRKAPSPPAGRLDRPSESFPPNARRFVASSLVTIGHGSLLWQPSLYKKCNVLPFGGIDPQIQPQKEGMPAFLMEKGVVFILIGKARPARMRGVVSPSRCTSSPADSFRFCQSRSHSV